LLNILAEVKNPFDRNAQRGFYLSNLFHYIWQKQKRKREMTQEEIDREEELNRERELPQAIWMKITDILLNEDNPRIIKEKKFDKLVASLRKFPKMIKLRPIVINKDNIILGGNMRYKACVEAGLNEVPVLIAEDLDQAEQLEFIIKDNVGFGEWDFDELANSWDDLPLSDWGLDLPVILTDEEPQEQEGKVAVFKIAVLTASEEEQDEVYCKLIEMGLNVAKK